MKYDKKYAQEVLEDNFNNLGRTVKGREKRKADHYLEHP